MASVEYCRTLTKPGLVKLGTITGLDKFSRSVTRSQSAVATGDFNLMGGSKQPSRPDGQIEKIYRCNGKLMFVAEYPRCHILVTVVLVA